VELWRIGGRAALVYAGVVAQPGQEPAMPKGQQHGREKKKPKKEKSAKQPSAYASQYGAQPSRIVEQAPAKKQ
jgi:hypothetical protein